MPLIFRLDASIREAGSATRSIADTLQSSVVADLDDVSIVGRDIGLAPLPSTAWAGAVFGPNTPAESRTPEQSEGLALATTLADELAGADGYIFAIPFYN